MKKLVSAMACFLVCFSIQAQTQQQSTNVQPENGRAKIVPVSQPAEQKAVEKVSPEAPKTHANCPHAATCPKAQAAANSQGEEKKPCAKQHENQSDAGAKTEPKAGCNHQNADHKAKCNHHSDEQPPCHKKQEEKK